MTHKNNEWFRGKPEQTGLYIFGGFGDEPSLEIARTIYGLIQVTRLPCAYSLGWYVRKGDALEIPPVPVPRPEAVDTPVLVRHRDRESWKRRYLAGWTEDGRIETWNNGSTSWSGGDMGTLVWNQWKLPEETDGTRT